MNKFIRFFLYDRRLICRLLRYAINPYRAIVAYLAKRKENRLIRIVPSNHMEALSLLKGKKKLRCLFLAIFPQVWKYDLLYLLMREHPRFEPLILVCPRVNFGKDSELSMLNECYDYFKVKGYKVIKSYNEATDTYVSVEELSPDIIFYTNPYKGLIDDRYYITQFQKKLTVYVPYMFGNNNDMRRFHDSLFHNIVWRFYAESEQHKSYSVDSSRCKGRNVVVSGYPGIEPLIDSTHIPSKNNWKIKDGHLKRIIWAPHHTITAVGNVNYSCFIRYADFMLLMARKYADKVQFVFKPHPLLKDKLNLLWGREKTNMYYNQWKSMDNSSLNDGDYVDLFLTSDAMIHDSGSFVVEYLYTNKPVMRTINGIPLESMFNGFALSCLDNYYMANDENDIEQFIQNVINNIDPMREKRTKFVDEVLMPKGSPSQNILDDILDSIDNQILYRN